MEDELLQQKMDYEIKMRDGTAKLLAASRHPHQMLEATKNLLMSNTRMMAYMSELQQRRTDQVIKPKKEVNENQNTCKAKLAVSDIRIPLMWKDSDHFSKKASSSSAHSGHWAVFCMLSIGTEIYDTVLLKDVDSSLTDICFDDVIVFNDIPADFTLKLEVFCHKLSTDDLASSTPRKIKKRFSHIGESMGRSVGKRLSGLKDDTGFMANMLVGPKFDTIGHSKLTIEDISDYIQTFDMHDQQPSDLPLFGNICCRLAAQPHCMLQSAMTGPLKIKYNDKERLYWCELKRLQIRCWENREQSENNSRAPAVTVPLTKFHKTRLSKDSIKVVGHDGGKDVNFTLKSEDKLQQWWTAIRQHQRDQEKWREACEKLMEIKPASPHKVPVFLRKGTASVTEDQTDNDSPMTRILNRLNVMEPISPLAAVPDPRSQHSTARDVYQELVNETNNERQSTASQNASQGESSSQQVVMRKSSAQASKQPGNSAQQVVMRKKSGQQGTESGAKFDNQSENSAQQVEMRESSQQSGKEAEKSAKEGTDVYSSSKQNETIVQQVSSGENSAQEVIEKDRTAQKGTSEVVGETTVKTNQCTGSSVNFDIENNVDNVLESITTDTMFTIDRRMMKRNKSEKKVDIKQESNSPPCVIETEALVTETSAEGHGGQTVARAVEGTSAEASCERVKESPGSNIDESEQATEEQASLTTEENNVKQEMEEESKHYVAQSHDDERPQGHLKEEESSEKKGQSQDDEKLKTETVLGDDDKAHLKDEESSDNEKCSKADNKDFTNDTESDNVVSEKSNDKEMSDDDVVSEVNSETAIEEVKDSKGEVNEEVQSVDMTTNEVQSENLTDDPPCDEDAVKQAVKCKEGTVDEKDTTESCVKAPCDNAKEVDDIVEIKEESGEQTESSSEPNQSACLTEAVNNAQEDKGKFNDASGDINKPKSSDIKTDSKEVGGDPRLESLCSVASSEDPMEEHSASWDPNEQVSSDKAAATSDSADVFSDSLGKDTKEETERTNGVEGSLNVELISYVKEEDYVNVKDDGKDSCQPEASISAIVGAETDA